MIKTADGKLRKENPTITEAIESDVIKLKTTISRAEVMATLQDHPGWIAVRDILKDKLARVEKELDDFKTKDHRQVDLLMQQRFDFKFFSTIVEDFVASIPGFEAKLAQAENELSARRKAVSA